MDGVSKLSQIHFNSKEDAQAHNFRKMLMAMTNDIRVILVKLADRLHNMRTLEALDIEQRRRIARETLEIYAPIAQRLGINNIRLELEELGFMTLYPMRHRILEQQIIKTRGHRKEIINKIRNALKRRLRQEKTPAKILGREKHLYGIYEKMSNNKVSFNEVYDVYAFRIIVDNVDACYRVLGLIHNLYKPVPLKFKDYIAIPKVNGYQSLHTVLFGPFGVPIEVQIRTSEMDDLAEAGVAAHWLYKSGSSNEQKSAQKRAREWLKSVLDMQATAGNSEEFLENVKVDLFPDSVYNFTPKGRIVELPRGATAVDFAYTIHTDVGNSCVGVRINRRLAPLGTVLTTGQTVEIINASNARPDPAWLNFAITAKARSNIRHFLKNLQKSEAESLGKRLLVRELKLLSAGYDNIQPQKLKKILHDNHLENKQHLLREIGLGNQMAKLIAGQLTEKLKLPENKKISKNGNGSPLVIKGTEGMVVNFPKCCLPIPGDKILGFVTAGKGIVIHQQPCPNVTEYRNHPEKWVNVVWEKDIKNSFQTHITVEATNQRGMLAKVASIISEEQANITHIEVTDKDDRYLTLRFVVEVKDRTHLARIIRKVRIIKGIAKILRK